MRTYMHLFLNLLLPIVLIVTIASIIYFSLNYDFSKALNLGIIAGVLISIPVSLIGSLILFLTRKNKSSLHEPDIAHNANDTNMEVSRSQNRTPVEEKFMLLMDKDLAFEVALFSIIDQNLGDAATKETKEKNSITLRTYNESIQIITTELTRHTAQIVIKGLKNSQEMQRIISYIKEKEYSFLQY